MYHARQKVLHAGIIIKYRLQFSSQVLVTAIKTYCRTCCCDLRLVNSHYIHLNRNVVDQAAYQAIPLCSQRVVRKSLHQHDDVIMGKNC